MDFTAFFWLILAMAALQPVVARRMRDAARSTLMRRIENRRGTRVIPLCYRQETMSLLGFPLVRSVEINDCEEVLRALDMTEDRLPVDLILHLPAGLSIAAVQIARAIARRPGKVSVFVPHCAFSGGTLIALAADEIVMSPNAVLGGVDPQIGGIRAASLLRVVREKPPAEVDAETLVLADQAERAVEEVRETLLILLAGKYAEDRAEEIARLLADGRWTRGGSISYEELRAAGHPVSAGMPREVLQLMALCPQPVCSVGDGSSRSSAAGAAARSRA